MTAVLDDLRHRAGPVLQPGWPRQVAAAVILVLAWVTSSWWMPVGAPLGVVMLGAVLGTVTALLAMGLILIYKSDRIVNFAYGAMGGVAGVISVTLFLDKGVNYWLSIVLGVAVGAVVGALTEILAIRRFSNASRLVLTVATIGLTQILGGFQLLIPIWMDASSVILGGFEVPFDVSFSVGPQLFVGPHILIAIATPLVIVALGWFLAKTDAGVAIRASAENRDRALLLGIPTKRLSTLVWTLAGALSAFTFIMKAPFQGTASDALGGLTAVLPALAAAVVARMESLPVAVGAGIGLGIMQQLLLWNDFAPSSVDVWFLGVILVALLLQRSTGGRAKDAGGASWSTVGVVRPIPRELRGLPEIRIGRALVLLVVVAAAIIVPHLYDASTVFLMAVALVWGIVAVSLVALTGWGGHISLGQFAIVGASAVLAGNMIHRWHVDLFVTMVATAIIGGLVALLIGLPALRIKGLFLAVTTLAFAVALDSYFLNPVNFADQIPDEVARPELWGAISLDSEWRLYYLCLAVLAVTIGLALMVRSARAGRVLLATRDNDRAADAMAVPTTQAKIAGFVLAGMIAGVAGVLHVMLLGGVRVGSYQPVQSVEVFSMAVIGGLGSIGGSLLGVFALRWLEQVVDQAYRLLVTGAGLLFILLVLPGGLGQAVMNVRDRALRIVAKRRGILVPSLLADRRDEDDDHPEDETDLLAGALGADPGPNGSAGNGDRAGEPDPKVGANR